MAYTTSSDLSPFRTDSNSPARTSFDVPSTLGEAQRGVPGGSASGVGPSRHATTTPQRSKPHASHRLQRTRLITATKFFEDSRPSHSFSVLR